MTIISSSCIERFGAQALTFPPVIEQTICGPSGCTVVDKQSRNCLLGGIFCCAGVTALALPPLAHLFPAIPGLAITLPKVLETGISVTYYMASGIGLVHGGNKIKDSLQYTVRKAGLICSSDDSCTIEDLAERGSAFIGAMISLHPGALVTSIQPDIIQTTQNLIVLIFTLLVSTKEDDPAYPTDKILKKLISLEDYGVSERAIPLLHHDHHGSIIKVGYFSSDKNDRYQSRAYTSSPAAFNSASARVYSVKP